MMAVNRLAITNSGGRRARLSHLVQDGRVLVKGLAGYALSGSTLIIQLATPIHPGRIDFVTDSGPRWIDVKE